jgi:ubiquinone/menaquinone biosynthesis C-methylase UbiE
VADHFDTIATAYDSWFDSRKGRLYERLQGAALARALDARSGTSVLEVGCGTGFWAPRVIPDVSDYCGIDLSPGMLRFARERGLLCARADAAHLPFDDDSFDRVFAMNVLELVPDPSAVVSEMARVVRPGGRIVVGILSKWSWIGIARRIRKSPTFLPALFFTPSDVRDLLLPWGRPRLASNGFFEPFVFLAAVCEGLGGTVGLPGGALVVGWVDVR